MSIKQVLQINVRLSEGGAAGVARSLSEELERVGIASPFAYGYGPGARVSPIHDNARHLRITPLPIAAINKAHYSIWGSESPWIHPQSKQELLRAMSASDIVHLHVVHSYFIPTEGMVDLLVRAGKPVAWTLHDQWTMTGRCAQPKGCERWKSGCQICPDLKAYPPAKIDRADVNWVHRRDQIRRLQTQLPTAIVACADWLGNEANSAGLQNVRVIKNSVDRPFWDALEGTVDAPQSAHTRNLFICRDLRDSVKVNWSLLESISQQVGQTLTVIGDHPPRLLPGVNHIAALNDRRELALAMREHDRLVFTSKVDYYPLTIAEALTAGMEVFALDSMAAREFQSNSRLRLFDSEDAMLRALGTGKPGSQLNELRQRDSFFAPTRMTSDYIALYKELGAVQT